MVDDFDRQIEQPQTGKELLKTQLRMMLLDGLSHLFVTSPDSDEIKKLSFLEILFSDLGLSEEELLAFVSSFFKVLRAQKVQGIEPKSYNRIVQEQLALTLKEANYLESLLKNEEESELINEIRRIVKRGRRDGEARSPFVQLSAAISMDFSDVLRIDSQKRITARPVLEAIVANNSLTESQKSMLIGIFVIQRFRKDSKYSGIIKEQLGITYGELSRFALERGTELPDEDFAVAFGDEQVEPEILRAIFVYLEENLAKQTSEADTEAATEAVQAEAEVIQKRVGETQVAVTAEVIPPVVAEPEQAVAKEIPPQNLYEFVYRAIEEGRFVYRDRENNRKSLLGLILSLNMRFDPGNPSMNDILLKELAEVCIDEMKEKGYGLGAINYELIAVLKDLRNELRFATEEINIEIQINRLISVTRKLKEELGFVPKGILPGQFMRGSESWLSSTVHKVVYSVAFAAALVVGGVVLFSEAEFGKGGKALTSSASAPEPEVESAPKFRIILDESVIDDEIVVNQTLTEQALMAAGWTSVEFEDGEIKVEGEDSRSARLSADVFKETDSIGVAEFEGEWDEAK